MFFTYDKSCWESAGNFMDSISLTFPEGFSDCGSGYTNGKVVCTVNSR